MNSGFLTDKIQPVRRSTRMDNETYRIRVGDLFRQLYIREPEAAAVAGDEAVSAEAATSAASDGLRLDESVRQQLQELALMPRKARHFMRVLNDQPVDVQRDFLRFIMARVKEKAFPADLERHVRHRFYEAREEFKGLLATLDDEASVEALMRVIVQTEENWLAGELIGIVGNFPPERLQGPIRNGLQSESYHLQCLAIHLAGRSKDDVLLEELGVFYRRPYGENIDRLESKTYEALMAGIEGGSDDLLLRWLRDSSSRVRDLGIVSVSKRKLPAAVGDLWRLVLVDAKTRGRAAQALLDFHAEQLFEFSVDDAGGKAIAEILGAAKQEPLLNMLKGLLRDQSGGVREVVLRALPLLPDAKPLMATVARTAAEDRLRGVQLAALETLAALDAERFFEAAAETLADSGSLHPDVVDGLDRVIGETMTDEERKRLEAEAAQRRKRREEVLDKFSGTIESWRHDLE